MQNNISEEELSVSLALLKKLLWADRATKEKLQSHGINVVPANFYSNTPSVTEILNSFEYTEACVPYLNEQLFDKTTLFENLEILVEFSKEFNPAQNDNEDSCERFFWNNSQFSYSDAMAYYAFIRRIKPTKIIEIGSGFSSLIALEALEKNAYGKLECIEPFPRPFISKLAELNNISLRKKIAQDITVEYLNSTLEDGDILFIDSTHTVKTGSDCLHIYLRLLPYIKKKIFVHVHDIFLPFGMPQNWALDHQIYWTEQYILYAWMLDNPRVKTLYGSSYHNHFNPKLLDSLMHGRFQRGGASFWFEYY